MALSNRWVKLVFWLRFAPKRRFNTNSSHFFDKVIQYKYFFVNLVALYHKPSHNKQFHIIMNHQHAHTGLQRKQKNKTPQLDNHITL